MRTKKMHFNINMNLSVASGNRILFGKDGVYDVVVEGDTITTSSVSCSENAVLDGSNIVPYIEAQRLHPVLDNIVGASNIQDGAVSLSKLAQSPPLSTDRGGTGLSNIAVGQLLVGTAAGDLEPSSAVWWNGSNLEVRGDLQIGDVRIGLSNDVYGRQSLFSFDSQGAATNMVTPGLAPPECEITDISTGASDVTVTLTKRGGFPVDAFFAWSETVTSLNGASVATAGRPGVQNSGRVPFRGDTVQYTIASGTPVSVYTVAAVMRDARGTLSAASHSSFTFP